MINKKYKHMFTFFLAGLVLSIFAWRTMRDYYPTVHCDVRVVQYYCFAKHTLLTKKVEK
jgi:hypothetical protein